jgi:hypothetical protein
MYARLDLADAWAIIGPVNIRTGLGYPPAGSSPARQEGLGLNEDLTLRPKKSEGEKLREG